jgi:hypothetical protein
MNGPFRIEGYAIVSDNGMIATAKGTKRALIRRMSIENPLL